MANATAYGRPHLLFGNKAVRRFQLDHSLSATGYFGAGSMKVAHAILSAVIIVSSFSSTITVMPLAGRAARAGARAVVIPSPDLRLTASLDSSILQRGGSVRLTVELRNEGRAPVPVAAAGRCNPALQPIILGAAGNITWAPGLPLCLEFGGGQPLALAAGGALTASRCFTPAAAPVPPCDSLELAPGIYRLGGTFYSMKLPLLPLAVAP
jgi:hypothetical protein